MLDGLAGIVPTYSAFRKRNQSVESAWLPSCEREKIPLLLFVVMAEPAPLPKAILPLPVVTLLSAATPTPVLIHAQWR